MKTFYELTKEFRHIAREQGHILEVDYHKVCADITDEVMLNKIADWLLRSGIPLKSIGPQYKQEIERKLQKPNINDIKDTKYRTHKNKDKFQESKKKDVEEDKKAPEASMHLDTLIRNLQDEEPKEGTEFYPPWKKYDERSDKNKEKALSPTASEVRIEAGSNSIESKICIEAADYSPVFKLLSFIQDNPDVGDFLRRLGIDPSQWDMRYDAAGLQQYITSIISKYGSNIYLNPEKFPQLAGVNLGNPSEAEAAIGNLSDTDVLRSVHMALERGEYTAEPAVSTQKEPWQQPSSVTTEVEFSEAEKAAPSLELMSRLAGSAVQVLFGEAGPLFYAGVADTVAEKASGLEPYDSIPQDAGLYFPFDEPDNVIFHVGKVRFPIDIVFLMETPHGLEVSTLVEDAQPGDMSHWTANNIKAVLELNGGSCKKHNIRIGTTCTIGHCIGSSVVRVEASSIE